MSIIIYYSHYKAVYHNFSIVSASCIACGAFESSGKVLELQDQKFPQLHDRRDDAYGHDLYDFKANRPP